LQHFKTKGSFLMTENSVGIYGTNYLRNDSPYSETVSAITILTGQLPERVASKQPV
jgi:hypothetical protein